MELANALSLIKPAIVENRKPQRWADLGCGNGLFSEALAGKLASGSSILCVDTNTQAFESIPNFSGVEVIKAVADFNDFFPAPPFDGILMANSLHFILDKSALLLNIKASLKPGGRLIIVEYDIEKANPWVPYPVAFNQLALLADKSGFKRISLLHKLPSRYNDQMIYSAALLP